MNSDSKILICYNEPYSFYENYVGKSVENKKEKIDLSETEFKKNLVVIEKLLKQKFPNTELLGVDANIKNSLNALKRFAPDVIMNFVESISGDAKYEIYFTGLYDLLGLAYTGNNALTLGNCLLKFRTKQLLQFKGISTPQYKILPYNKKIIEKNFPLHFPVILKLTNEDASIGISEFSVVKNFKELKKQLSFLFNNYKQDVIAEEYIKGRELNVSILGGEVLPISEIVFDGLPQHLPKIVTYEAKWSPDSVYYKNSNAVCPAKLSDQQVSMLNNIAIESFKALGCRDYARVDIRLGKRNKPYVIEVNPNPDISPDSGFVRSAKAAGIEYDELLYKLVSFAYNRKSYDTEAAA